MDYPDNFETPAFPAGKRIAVSRVMAIWTLIAFFLIVCLCGILIWSVRSDRLVPFMISTNNDIGEWKIVGTHNKPLEYSIQQTVQESAVNKMITQWFSISKDSSENDAAWQKCEREACANINDVDLSTQVCAVYCNSSDELYSRFVYEIMPGYMERAQNGEVWRVDEKSIFATPIGKASEHGGTWQVDATIISSTGELFTMKVFIKIARNKNFYPQTMGFYIADFNAYRTN